MTEKVHDISSAPKDAPRNDEAATDVTVETVTPGRLRTFLSKHKMFFIGLGSGVAVGAAGLAAAKAASEEEDEVVETPES